MSKLSEQKLAEFLETASPYEIMVYWRKTTGQDADKVFDDLFKRLGSRPVLDVPYRWSPIQWYRAIVKWRRTSAQYQRRVALRAEAGCASASYAKHWRLGPAPILKHKRVCAKCGSAFPE